MKSLFMVSCALLLLCAPLAAEFKREPLPDDTPIQKLTEWYRGSVKLGDKEYEAALVDMDKDGLKVGRNDVLLVDLNGDGKFKFDIQAMIVEGATPLVKRVALGGETWDLTLDPEAPDVTLKRYEGDCGRLETSLQPGVGTPECVSFGSVMGKDTFFVMTAGKGTPSGRIPVGEYEGMFVVTFLEDGKPSAQLQYTIDGKLAIEKGKTHSLLFGKPGKLTAEVSEGGGKLRVNRSLESGKGMKLASVTTADAEGKMKPPKPPLVEIRAAGSDEIVAKGAMEYG